MELKTAPNDIRFPCTNQTRHCYTRYLEYHTLVPLSPSLAHYYRLLRTFTIVSIFLGKSLIDFIWFICFSRCIQEMGENALECGKFADYYRSLCPVEWVQNLQFVTNHISLVSHWIYICWILMVWLWLSRLKNSYLYRFKRGMIREPREFFLDQFR